MERFSQVVGASKHPVIASGGVGTLWDVETARDAGAYGVIIGKALYDGRIKLDEALKYQD